VQSSTRHHRVRRIGRSLTEWFIGVHTCSTSGDLTRHLPCESRTSQHAHAQHMHHSRPSLDIHSRHARMFLQTQGLLQPAVVPLNLCLNSSFRGLVQANILQPSIIRPHRTKGFCTAQTPHASLSNVFAMCVNLSEYPVSINCTLAATTHSLSHICNFTRCRSSGNALWTAVAIWAQFSHLEH
jgi:hypothetical protein